MSLQLVSAAESYNPVGQPCTPQGTFLRTKPLTRPTLSLRWRRMLPGCGLERRKCVHLRMRPYQHFRVLSRLPLPHLLPGHHQRRFLYLKLSAYTLYLISLRLWSIWCRLQGKKCNKKCYPSNQVCSNQTVIVRLFPRMNSTTVTAVRVNAKFAPR